MNARKTQAEPPLAIRCAAGAVAGAGPEVIRALLALPDAELGRALKAKIVEICNRLEIPTGTDKNSDDK